MRFVPMVAAEIALVMSLAAVSLQGGEAKSPPKSDESRLTIRLVDEAGKPVAGARTGYFVLARDFDKSVGGKWMYRGEAVSNAQGVAVARQEPDRPFIYARQAEQGLVGIGHVRDKKPDGTLSITMRPECTVSLHLTSKDLGSVGRSIERPMVTIGLDDGGVNYLLGLSYARTDFSVPAALPPGTFHFWCAGTNTCGVPKDFAIKSGERKLDLGTIDLPAERLVILQGKPAPELDEVAAWKNSPPLKLADLRGKVVLLEFWGCWCGPCVVTGIPEMMKLHDKLRGDGLVVIGVHTSGEYDNILTVAQLDARMAEVRRTIWKGKDIAFPVAITRPRKASYYPGGPQLVLSKAALDYGISRWPSTILIDRQGNIVGRFDAAKKADQEKLKQMLAAGFAQKRGQTPDLWWFGIWTVDWVGGQSPFLGKALAAK